MSFEQILIEQFPHALREEKYIERSYQSLGAHGFNRDTALACVGICRDELTQPLAARIQSAWGEAFNFSSLGGMLFLGLTGFLAAERHAPKGDGRERYVFFSMPHIAISQQGEAGVCYRPGRVAPSHACGALLAFCTELSTGHLNLSLDPDDVEQSLLKQRLMKKITWGHSPNLLALTRIAYEVILEDLERLVNLTVDTDHNDYAVLAGIQVHGPQGANYIWPGVNYAVCKKNRIDLAL